MYRLTHTEGITVVADSAAYLATNKLNLTEFPFHACVMSFYKIMGFPNLGALVLRNDFARKLVKRTYTDASAELVFADSEEFRPSAELFEDDFLTSEMAHGVIIGLESFNALGIEKIHNHVWRLTRKLYQGIDRLTHSTGNKSAEIYGNHHLNDSELQGGIVAFNMKKMRGEFVGYAEVVRRASQDQFHLRGGCHCNPGACFTAMKLTEDKVKAYFDNKTTCGDYNDIIDGVPLGSVRASLGWATTDEDVDQFLNWLEDVFIV
jgi:molybdenum cofactor sulfurtransferase